MHFKIVANHCSKLNHFYDVTMLIVIKVKIWLGLGEKITCLKLGKDNKKEALDQG